MKLILRRLVMVALLVALVVSFTACGAEVDEPEEETQEEGSSKEEEEAIEEDQKEEEEEDMDSIGVEGNYFSKDFEQSQDLKNWIESKKHEAGEYRYPENERIYLIAAGERNTGGYSIKVTEESLEGKDLTLSYKVLAPGPDDIVTQAITYPYVTIKITEEVENVEFVKNE